MSRAQQKQQVPVGDDDLWDEGLFGGGEAPPAAAGAYTAKDIEVLEGPGAGAQAAGDVYRRRR